MTTMIAISGTKGMKDVHAGRILTIKGPIPITWQEKEENHLDTKDKMSAYFAKKRPDLAEWAVTCFYGRPMLYGHSCTIFDKNGRIVAGDDPFKGIASLKESTSSSGEPDKTQSVTIYREQ